VWGTRGTTEGIGSGAVGAFVEGMGVLSIVAVGIAVQVAVTAVARYVEVG
jgi:hypothetical protein